MQSIHLQGAEDVQRAASSMRSSADDMRNAASTISAALDAHRTFMASWLEQFRSIMQPPPQPAAVRDPETPPAENEWRQWKGGFAPVDGGIMVWTKHLNGDVERGLAKKVEWRHYKGSNYVIGWAL